MAWYNLPISHGYIPNYQGAGTDTPHYAIDLAAPMHTPFSFPTSGTIKQADYAVWSGQPGGGEVFLKPDDGGSQQYVYHLDEIDVHAGQHVSAGQQVGLSGGQNSGGAHPVSSMWSSGPHIHYGFFDSYINTPAGGRPHGTDPTSYIQNLSKNNGALSDPGNFWGGVAGGAVGATTGSTPAASAASSAIAGWIPTFSKDMAIRGALILAGAIMAIMGMHALLAPGLNAGGGGDQTDQYTSSVAGEKKQAADSEAAQSKASTQRYRQVIGRSKKAPPPPAEAAAEDAAEVAVVA